MSEWELLRVGIRLPNANILSVCWNARVVLAACFQRSSSCVTGGNNYHSLVESEDQVKIRVPFQESTPHWLGGESPWGCVCVCPSQHPRKRWLYNSILISSGPLSHVWQPVFEWWQIKKKVITRVFIQMAVYYFIITNVRYGTTTSDTTCTRFNNDCSGWMKWLYRYEKKKFNQEVPGPVWIPIMHLAFLRASKHH